MQWWDVRGSRDRSRDRVRKEKQLEDNLTYLSSFINIIFELSNLHVVFENSNK